MREIFYFVFLISLPISINAQQIVCPQSIETTESLKKVTPGWEAYVQEASSILSHVTFFSGHPREKASLAPDKDDASLSQLVWTFSSKEKIWLGCSYKGSHLQLIKKLDEVKSCSVTYDNKHSLEKFTKIISINCEK